MESYPSQEAPICQLGSPAELSTKLAELVSPQPIVSGGILDARPNLHFDRPEVTDYLPDLPIRQLDALRKLKGVLSSSAVGNLNVGSALVGSIEIYIAELETRGTQPSLGTLEHQAALFALTLHELGRADAPSDKAFRLSLQQILRTHTKMMGAYPLNDERENYYAAVAFDPSKVDFHKIYQLSAESLTLTRDLHMNGFATVTFLADHMRMVEDVQFVAVLPDYAIGDDCVLLKKRAALRNLGWWESVICSSPGESLAANEILLALTSKGREIIATLMEPHEALTRV